MTTTLSIPTNRPARAPIQASGAIMIDADVETVFGYLSDLEHNPEWNWAIVSTTAMFDGPPRQGATYMQMRSFPYRGTEVLEIATFRHNAVLEVATTLDGDDALYRYDVRPVAAGATKVTMTLYLSRDVSGRTDLYASRLSAAMSANLRDLELAIVRLRHPSECLGT